MKVLMIGPPGSGKGTHGSRLAHHLGVRHIAAGDLLRAEVSAQTSIGRHASDLMGRGELVPDLLVAALIVPTLLDAADSGGFVLDGFPRSVAQVQLMRELGEAMNLFADLVVCLQAPEPELVQRILARARAQGRNDDTTEVVAQRLRIFDEATRPLIAHYQQRGVLRVVDAARPIDEVSADIIALAEGLVPQP
jgi:adenylate kinase